MSDALGVSPSGSIGLQEHVGCSEEFINGLEYSQVAGLIIGMIALGFSVDRVGRRLGSILTASVMLIGGISSTSIICFPVALSEARIGVLCDGCHPIQPSSAWKWAFCTRPRP